MAKEAKDSLIRLSKSCLSDAEKNAVIGVLNREYLGMGDEVRRFEAALEEFLESLEEYRGYPITKLALKFIVHTFVRPGALRSAVWTDFDFENKIWRIPAEKMKMNEEHLVPLSDQVLEILDSVRDYSGNYKLVFPSTHDRRNVMSDNTLTNAIRKRLHFDATAHGFRTTASTILNEAGFRVDVIERQLAHGERNKVRAAYNRSQYLAERIKMMQWYADYLDELKTGSNVIAIRSGVEAR